MEDPLDDILKPLKSTNIRDIVSSPWYGDFLDVKIEDLNELIQVANYLEIKALMDAC